MNNVRRPRFLLISFDSRFGNCCSSKWLQQQSCAKNISKRYNSTHVTSKGSLLIEPSKFKCLNDWTFLPFSSDDCEMFATPHVHLRTQLLPLGCEKFSAATDVIRAKLWKLEGRSPTLDERLGAPDKLAATANFFDGVESALFCHF